jgi:protein-S-isoprenylcysteine O-methyltransferase Ste14
LTAILFGAVAYLTFLFTILYAIGLVSDFLVPKSIDVGVKTPISEAVAINLALMSLFALQHSVMACKCFKQWWTRFIPRLVERSTLFARLTLLLLFWQFRIVRIASGHQQPDRAANAGASLPDTAAL